MPIMLRPRRPPACSAPLCCGCCPPAPKPGSGQSCTPVRGRARLDRLRVVDTRRAGGEQLEVAIHGVLIERNQQVDSVAEAGDALRTGADRQECMSAANDGLIGVVGIQVQAAPAEDPGENVAWRGDSLSCGASDTDAKVCFITPSLTECRPFHEALALGRAQINMCIPVRGTPCLKVQLGLLVAGVYTRFLDVVVMHRISRVLVRQVNGTVRRRTLAGIECGARGHLMKIYALGIDLGKTAFPSRTLGI